MTEQSDQAARVCAVCARPLWRVTTGGTVEWTHSVIEKQDHPAVPVDAGDLPTGAELRCDFCSALRPRWELPAATMPAPGAAGYESLGAWAACDTCADLIRRDAWTALRRRAIAMATLPEGMTREGLDGTYGRLYRLLRRNITGPIREIP